LLISPRRQPRGPPCRAYPQLNAMQIARYPVIAVRIERTTSWRNLSVAEAI
jgi:hypothetical protein